MSNSDIQSPSQLEDADKDTLLAAYRALYAESKRINTTNKHVLKNVDRMTLNGQKRLETGMTIMAGVILKKLKRRSVTVKPDDFASIMTTNTIHMEADKDDNITYTLEGDFNA